VKGYMGLKYVMNRPGNHLRSGNPLSGTRTRFLESTGIGDLTR